MRISTIVISAVMVYTLSAFQSIQAWNSHGYGHHNSHYGHGGHGYDYLLPGLLLGHTLSNRDYAGNSHSYAGRDCRKVHKFRYDSYGSRTKISGTMCYDEDGDPYIVPGSRYTDHMLDNDYSN